jgi:threonine dehydrogenase-like Zn-dependent dehydrogenase
VRAVIFQGPGEPLGVQERPVPVPDGDEVAVRVRRSGICASDVRQVQSGTVLAGSTLGHEYTGEVIAVGDRVTGIRPGARVASMAFGPCGRCPACRAGRTALCAQRRPFRNAFGQYAVTTEPACRVVPEAVTDEAAALTEPTAVAVHAVSLAGALPGQRALVLGAGPAGLLVALLARRGGARIALAARSRRRAAQAAALGLPLLVTGPDGGAADLAGLAADALGGAPGVVFDCAGALASAVRCVAPGGRIVAVAAEEGPSSLKGYAALRKEAELRFSLAYDGADFDAAVALLGELEQQLLCLVTRTVALREFAAAFADVAAGGPDCKVLLDPWR